MKSYDHFDQTPRGLPGAKSKCPLYDNVEERHEREIKEAETAARAEVINDNPDVSEKDLEIKVSDAVKKATDERVKRAGAVPGGIPPGYGGYAGAGFAPGLLIPPRLRHFLRGPANDLEAAEDEADGNHDQVYDRILRLQEGIRAQRIQHLDNRRNRLLYGMAAGADAGHELDGGQGAANNMRGYAGAFAPRANRPAFLPPAAPRAMIPGGFNEDPFGGGDDGDAWNLHRLLDVPPAPAPALAVRVTLGRREFNPVIPRQDRVRAGPIRGPPPRQPGVNPAMQHQDRIELAENRLAFLRNQRNEQQQQRQAQTREHRERVQALQAMHQQAQQARGNEADQMQGLEDAQIAARQRFDDRRGGRGLVFRRDPLDPRRRHEAGGWPGQN